jgi:hypothetical protein
MFQSTSLSLARIPICVVSMRVEKHASLNNFLMPCEFLNMDKNETQYNHHHHVSAIV